MDLSNLTDEEVIKEIIGEGNVDAFGIIYDRYHTTVFNKCITFVKSEAVAKDLTHDIFLKAFVKLSQFNFESKFSTWFYSLTYRKCIDFVRKNSTKKERDYIDIEDIDQENINVLYKESEEEILSIDVNTLEQVLEKLRPKEKMILLMKYQDGLTISEIQQELDLGESATKMRLLRARKHAVAIYNQHFKL